MSAAASTLGVERHADRLRALSRSIRAEPELAFAEHRSAAKVAELVEAEGFEAEVAVGLLMPYSICRTGRCCMASASRTVPRLTSFRANTPALYHLRAPYVESLQQREIRVRACFGAGAWAT